MAGTFQLARQTKVTVGIDLSSRNLKMICLEAKGSGYRFLAHGHFKLSNIQGVHSALHNRSIRDAKICVNIQNENLKMHRVEVPDSPDDEIADLIKWNLRETVGGDTENYIFRYFEIEQGEDADAGLKAYQVFTLEQQYLINYQAALKDLGVPSPSIIEPGITALAHFITQTYSFKQNEIYGVVDCGETQALFSVISSKRLLFFRSLSAVTGDHLTAQISRDTGISPEQAEELKINDRETFKEERKQKIGPTISHYLSKMSLEVQNSIDSYHVHFPRQPITHLILAGGACRLAEMKATLSNNLSLPVAYIEAPPQIPLSDFLIYGVAGGLAL